MSGLDRNHKKEKGHIEIQTTPFPRDSNQGKANFEAQMLLATYLCTLTTQIDVPIK